MITLSDTGLLGAPLPVSERQNTAHGNGLALGFRQVSMPARRVCRGERVQFGL